MTHTLSQRMDFDHVIHVDADGNVTDAWQVYAPDLYDGELCSGSDDWTLLSGFTGQYGYHGPMMHDSEIISGSLERHILSTPGYYVALVGYWTCADHAAQYETCDCDNVEGWAIAYREDARA